MHKKLAIQFKAAFLLFIFSLNMFVGFACSIGLINVSDATHQHQETTEAPVHAHIHEHKNNEHQHANSKPHNHSTDHKDKKDKKGCCNDEVQKVQQLDKNINSNSNALSFDGIALVPPINYKSYTIIFSNTNLTKLRERFFYPPPPNILLNTQRFQI